MAIVPHIHNQGPVTTTGPTDQRLVISDRWTAEIPRQQPVHDANQRIKTAKLTYPKIQDQSVKLNRTDLSIQKVVRKDKSQQRSEIKVTGRGNIVTESQTVVTTRTMAFIEAIAQQIDYLTLRIEAITNQLVGKA